MAQRRLTVLDDLSLIHGIHRVEGKRVVTQLPSRPHVYVAARTQARAYRRLEFGDFVVMPTYLGKAFWTLKTLIT